MQNTGSTGTTCHDAITSNADFGGSLNTINGGLECPARSSHAGSVISRLDDYCRAVNALGANLLLSFDGCTGLEQRHAECLEASTCPNCVGIPILSPTNPVTFAPTKSPVVLTTLSPYKSPTTSVSSGVFILLSACLLYFAPPKLNLIFATQCFSHCMVYCSYLFCFLSCFPHNHLAEVAHHCESNPPCHRTNSDTHFPCHLNLHTNQ